MNKLLLSDINKLISNEQYFEAFEGTKILVTGATGLIGSIIIKSLLSYSEKSQKQITIYAACRSQDKFNKIFADYICFEKLKPIFSDILTLEISSIELDYIIHGASITDSKTFVDRPVETIAIALEGTKNLLQQCVNKKIKGFVYLSSLEIYGSFNSETGIKNVTEYDFGYINILSVRSSYSESKRMVENICCAYAKEYNVPVKIARLCQTFGAGVEYNDNRVFAQFARSIVEHNDIVLKTRGGTIRNYCYTIDAVSGILTILSKGNLGEAYNIANIKTTISIVDMAKKFCELFPECNSQVIFDIENNIEKLGYNPEIKLQLDSTKLESLGWIPLLNIDDMIKRLVEWFLEIKK